ncbi:helicase-like transcription factor isoform X2 [Convolutriloba macropyga]
MSDSDGSNSDGENGFSFLGGHDTAYYASFLSNLFLGGGVGLTIPLNRYPQTPSASTHPILGTIRTAVVGVQYYSGVDVFPRSRLMFAREPSNRFDPNAVKVTYGGRQIGHIKKDLAQVLAPYMDERRIELRGVVVSTNTSYAYPVDITVYGSMAIRSELSRRLQQKNFQWKQSSGRQRGANNDSSLSYKPMQVSAEEQIVNQKKLKGELEKVFEDVAQKLGSGFKKVEVSPHVITQLYPHQVQALSWMCDRENNKELPPFWKEASKKKFTNIVTDVSRSVKPAPLRGGILADEMGLGKSLEVLSLILTNSGDTSDLVTLEVKSENTKKVTGRIGRKNWKKKANKIIEDEDEGNVLSDTESSISCVTLSSDEYSDCSKNSENKSNTTKSKAKTKSLRRSTRKNSVKVSKTLSPIAESKCPGQVADIIDERKDFEDEDDDVPLRMIKNSRAAKRKALQRLSSDENVSNCENFDAVSFVRSIDSSNDENLKIEVVDLCSDENSDVSWNKNHNDSDTCESEKSNGSNRENINEPKRGKKIKYLEPMEDLGSLQPCSSKTADLMLSQTSAMRKSTRSKVKMKDSEGLKTGVDLDARSNQESADVYARFRKFRLDLKEFRSLDKPRATLLVCTVSLLANWLEQFETHLDLIKSGLSIFLYHGTERKDFNLDYIMRHDIVLSTYNILAMDFKNPKKGGAKTKKAEKDAGTGLGLLTRKFLRIVLDEGHLIRNPATKMSQALFSIEAERRWILSGTPIQNSLSEMWALMKFLRLEPFDDPEKGRSLWKQHIEKPVLNGDDLIVKSFKSLLMTLILRRTKTMCIDEKPIVKLPKKTIKILKVKLSNEELELYKSMESSGRVIVGSYFEEGRQVTHYAHIIAIITRLRQLVCHPSLCKKAFDLATEAIGATDDEETRNKLIETLKLIISSGTDEECCVCLDSLKSPVITQCAHVFCRPCIEKVLHSSHMGDVGNCPLCRSRVVKGDLIEAPREAAVQINSYGDDEWHSSAKVDTLINCLNDIRSKCPTTKSIVVSQFTSFLTVIEKPLKESGFKFVRFDGSLSAKKRDNVLHKFKHDSDTTVLLMSLRAGNLGLNLTCASNLFLMDPAWNPSVEDQCFDRCHRLGQQNDVTIHKLVCADTIEDQILAIQEKKRKLVQDAFSFTDAAKESREKRIGDIKTLFGINK